MATAGEEKPCCAHYEKQIMRINTALPPLRPDDFRYDEEFPAWEWKTYDIYERVDVEDVGVEVGI
uniref:Uncharacterized protein n=1 Tax=Oryza punctata TaxID=4537 RepID=A0A0E0LMM9_ORYPU